MANSPARERAIEALARRIAELGGKQRARVFHLSWWSDKLLAQSMADPAFRTALFRFVDTFPALVDDADIEAHLNTQFEGVDVPSWFGTGLEIAEWLPGGSRITGAVARRTIDRMAQQFIIGTKPDEVAAAVGRLWRRSTATTVDLLGEHTHSDDDADRYARRLSGIVDALAKAADTWPVDDLLDADDLGAVPRASVSVKLTALAPAFGALTADTGIEQASGRLAPILRRAADKGVFVWFDMERYQIKSLTHRLFRTLLDRPDLADLHAGIVLQAYLRDSGQDLADLADWARGRAIPPGVRLVKGAYWDTETVDADARGWPASVFENKNHTDANYEHLAQVLHQHHGVLRASFGSHNLRSLAAAIVDARASGIPDNGVELQLLYGMAEPVHDAVRRMGLRLRVYAPMGELVPGMAYLVRRLLENTSNDSFVRHHFAEGEELGALLAPPADGPLPGPPAPAHRSPTRRSSPGPYRPEPPAEWHHPTVKAAFRSAVEAEFAQGPRTICARIGGREVDNGRRFRSVDPADPAAVVAEVVACGPAEIEAAMAAVRPAAERWRRTSAADRADVLFRTAERLRADRFAIAALEVREAAKEWAEADGDVCEAIDFCEYYGRRMLALERGGDVQSPPGEENHLLYRSRGVAAVIAPWNFPLAILTGMTTASLVTGNGVVVKPAEQTPAIAAVLVRALEDAGLPPGVLAFAPGDGEEAGAPLAAHPGVDLIAFTGSRAVGLSIIEGASRRSDARRSIPRVIAELGGKNAIIVDSDADLDEVVPAVVHSAFGFSGQKCSAASRLIVLDAVHDEVVKRVVAATASLTIGPPRSPETDVGPVIDADAHARLSDAVARAGSAGEVVLARTDVPSDGYYIGPTVVRDVDPSSSLAREELFGPVLATFSVRDMASAVELANDSEYALTAGVFSRSPDHVRYATAELRAGNIYVNRSITGAVVGRQPFGGNAMSGVGSKAGGPDYLVQFCDPQAVAENTVRQGFAPPGGGADVRPPRRESATLAGAQNGNERTTGAGRVRRAKGVA